MLGKTCSLLSATAVDFSHLLLYFFLPYPQQLKLRGDIHRWDKSIPGGSILRMILCVPILTHIILSKDTKSLAVLIY